MCFIAHVLFFVFFFFKQKTAYEMRISDCSSDVCSSDLSAASELPMPVAGDAEYPEEIRLKYRYLDLRRERLHRNIVLRSNVISSQIGRASCRERVCQSCRSRWSPYP